VKAKAKFGVTLIEVLFSVLIVSVGLLGSISLIVVASSQAKKAANNEISALTARSAVHRFDVFGMRRAERWFFWNGTNFSPVATKTGFNSPYTSVQSYCIDSRFCVANAANWPTAKFFPYNSPTNTAGPRMNRVAFLSPVANGLPFFVSGDLASTLNANRQDADRMFRLEDDVSYLQDNQDRSEPASQVWIKNSSGFVLKRASDGRVSWLATLVPTLGIGANPTTGAPVFTGSDSFLLSVVVLRDRPIDMAMDDFNERTLGVVVQGDGSSGGEVALTAATADALKLRDDNWLLISGINNLLDRNGNVIDQVARFEWYRVSQCDDEPQPVAGGFQVFATLIGRDIDSGLTGLQAVAVNGVTTVHEKTIRLEYGSTF
jgi:type II secretory pathway pseudopilin PulG